RSEGIRQKTIAVSGSEALLTKAQKLSKNGYNVIQLADATDDTIVDVIYTDESELTNHVHAKVIWADHHVNATTNEAIIIQNKDILDEALRVRSGKSTTYINA